MEFHKYTEQGTTNKGSAGCVAAFREAFYRARETNRSIAIRVTGYDIWFTCDTRVALKGNEIEIATVHCDGQINFPK